MISGSHDTNTPRLFSPNALDKSRHLWSNGAVLLSLKWLVLTDCSQSSARRVAIKIHRVGERLNQTVRGKATRLRLMGDHYHRQPVAADGAGAPWACFRFKAGVQKLAKGTGGV